MLNEILRGAAEAMRHHFGGAMTIYTEKAVQKARIPSLHLRVESAERSEYLRGRTIWRVRVSATYLPTDPSDALGALCDVTWAMGSIVVNDTPISGCDIEAQLKDGTVSVKATYPIMEGRDVTERDMMEIMQLL